MICLPLLAQSNVAARAGDTIATATGADGLTWGAPQFLVALWAVPALFVIMWLFRAISARTRRRLGGKPARKLMLRGYRRWLPGFRHFLWLLAMASAILALSRPQWGHEYVEVKRRGLDILVVVDTSKSMLANDLKPSRLDKAKYALYDFTKILSGDRVGLVAFSGSSFLQCPLTSDYPAFRMSLSDLTPGIIRAGGTDIGSAVDTALDSFDEESNALRVIVLITDGEDHENNMAEVAARLVEEDVTLYAIGAATPEGGYIELRDRLRNTTTFLKDKEGQVVKSMLNDTALRELSSITGGFYIRAASTDFGLESVYSQGIDQMQRTEGQPTRIKVFQERYGWFLAFSLLLLAFESLLGHHQK